ncbi:MAG: G5 domain-containing protein [Clostridiales bacterium]|nr:G5 domain-containing protein [Candidatus Equinaster intestinalis]
MLKKVMQKIKVFLASLIKVLSFRKSSVKQKKSDSFLRLLGHTKKARMKKIAIYSAFAVIATLATTFSLLASINKVVVNDGENTACVYTLRSNPLDVLHTVDFIEGDYTVTSVNESSDDTVINLRYVFPVYVTKNGKTTEVSFMHGDTVQKAIELAGIKLSKNDSVNLSLKKKLYETTYIDITSVEYLTESHTETIPYSKKTVYSSSSTGSKTTTTGVNGEKTVTTVTKIVNGEKQSPEVVKEEVTKQAVDEVYTVGTKNAPKTISTLNGNVELDENGNPVNFSKHITVQATAYCNDSSSASGMKLQPGCVAINPGIFDYGTEFYIKSSDGKFLYGYAVAADTGGFIKARPTNFDLYFNTEAECEQFGRRNIEVWVLKK